MVHKPGAGHDNSDERVQAYALYLGEKQFKMLEQVRKVMPAADLSHVPVEQIEKDHEAYQALEASKKWFALTRDIAGLAAEVDMTASYMLHMSGSDLIHSNPTKERSYVRDAPAGVYFNSAACMPDSGFVPIFAAQHLLFIADILNDVLELGADDNLRSLMDCVQQTQPSDESVD